MRLAFAFDDDGRLPWDTIIYSCVKKSGKTTVNGAVTLRWGFTQEAPNEILILANDLEQILARVFRTMEGIIQYSPELQREAEVQSAECLVLGLFRPEEAQGLRRLVSEHRKRLPDRDAPPDVRGRATAQYIPEASFCQLNRAAEFRVDETRRPRKLLGFRGLVWLRGAGFPEHYTVPETYVRRFSTALLRSGSRSTCR